MDLFQYKAGTKKLAYIGSKPGKKEADRDSDSWFTPVEYIDAARKVFGGSIDFDPFSSEAANRIVGAKEYYTVDDDALTTPWPGATAKKRARNRGVFKGSLKGVWMNPPYSSPVCGQAIDCFIQNFNDYVFEEGIVLVNNATDTIWFREKLYPHTRSICFTKRIKFWNADGKAVSGNTRGQAFLFFTHSKSPSRVEAFEKAFSPFGVCLRPSANTLSDARSISARRVNSRQSKRS